MPFGKKAKDFVFSEIFGKEMDIVKAKNDRYRRTIGYVSYDQSKDLGEEFLKVGLAWVWRSSSSEKYKQLQAQAKEKGNGLWSDENAIDPYRWRREMRKNKSYEYEIIFITKHLFNR